MKREPSYEDGTVEVLCGRFRGETSIHGGSFIDLVRVLRRFVCKCTIRLKSICNLLFLLIT